MRSAVERLLESPHETAMSPGSVRMRPRRIIRRFVARARHWGTPHVHCPSCGADSPVPETDQTQICFTCKIHWYRQELTEDRDRDWETIEGRAASQGRWTVTFHPVLVDVPRAGGGKTSTTLDCAFVYFPGTQA